MPIERVRGAFWRLEPREAQLRLGNGLDCNGHAGGTVVVVVQTSIETVCEQPGPVNLIPADDGTYVVESFVWVRHVAAEGIDPCLGTTDLAERTVTFEDAAPGVMRIEEPRSGSSVELRISEPEGPRDCTGLGDRGDACVLDCECRDDLSCIVETSEFGECNEGRCGNACNTQGSSNPPLYHRDLECPPEDACALTGLVSSVCMQRCGPDADCIGGMIWEPAGPELGRPCEDDTDCEGLLLCVEHRRGSKTCQIPCFSNEMRCPSGYACRPHGDWVCQRYPD